MSNAVFIRDGELFHPQPNAGSPWSPTTLHGAAPAGLIGYAMEQLLPSTDMQLARLTIDLFRPVPMAPLRLQSEVIRAGRKIQVVQVSIWSGEVEICRSTGIMLRQTPITLAADTLPPTDKPIGPEGLATTGIREGADASAFTLLPGFHTIIEARRVSGIAGKGVGCVWLRIPVPLIEGIENSPLMRVAALSDLGNGIAQLQAGEGVGFINADISLNLHRLPEGEWICVDARTLAQPCGIGMVETVLYDHLGPIGRVTQVNLANPIYRG